VIERFSPFLRLSANSELHSFDCTNEDLNEFLLKDAKNHLADLMAVTYYWDDGQDTVAYYCVLNDAIRQDDPSHSKKGRIFRNIRRHYVSYPAVKIGRFAVHRKYQSQGIGSEIMDSIKGYFLDRNKTGCRFIIVDADNNPRTLKFYEKNGFDYLTGQDEKDESRLMYFDLAIYAPYVNNASE
jgi:GNAT superfamily N-acetyltransferase